MWNPRGAMMEQPVEEYWVIDGTRIRPVLPAAQVYLNQITALQSSTTFFDHESKLLDELLKSNNPDDKRKLNLIIADIAKSNDQAKCSHLLRKEYNVSVLNEKNQTMLHIAFYNQSHAVVYEIMSSPYFMVDSTNCTDFNGLTHLHIACAYGYSRLAERYLEMGSDINAVYKIDAIGEFSGFTPLHFAVVKQYVPIVELLLKNGADINIADFKGRTPIHIVCYDNFKEASLEIMQLLISDSSVNINTQDYQGNTPIMNLFCEKFENNPFKTVNFDIKKVEPEFKMLMKAGADVCLRNSEGNTVLHLLIKNLKFVRDQNKFFAMSFDDTDFIKLIKTVLESSSDVINLFNQFGETPLQLAVSAISLDIVKLLLDHDASLDDLLVGNIFYPNVVPVFKPVWNFFAIIQLLAQKKYTVSPLDNLQIILFLIHEAYDCDCQIHDQEYVSKVKFNMLLNFGSSNHVIDILNKILYSKKVTLRWIASELRIYMQLVKSGKFYIEKDLNNFLEKHLASVYGNSRVYTERYSEELERLKLKVIGNGIKLYDLMLKSPHDITRIINNIDFSTEFTDDFPSFKYFIKGHITKSLIRSYVVSSTYELLRHKLFSSIPDLCCERIIKFLSNLDILRGYAAVVLSQ